ncbi:hypothetical protein ACH9L7_00810 [Haloferax sp. S1W]|uniref:hypothetical protein n=1 Tax=Haloferax sp. S1W TaxID=3377110 RepID=UPI0037C58EDB
MSERTPNRQQARKYRDLFIAITGQSTVTERQEESRLRRATESEKYQEHQALSEYVKSSTYEDGLEDAVGGGDSSTDS